MLENDNSSRAEKPDPERPRPCCPSTPASRNCSPDSSGGRENWKTLIFFVVLAAAGIVIVRSLARRSNAAAEQPNEAFPLVAVPKTPETASANTVAQGKAAHGAEPALWGPELDSLAALDKVATNVDTVFILICDEDQVNAQAVTGEIETATKKIRSRGNRASAFKLKNDTVDYENLAEQFSVPTVLAMVKGLGYSAVSEQITEANLLEAFVTASRPQAGCCPPGTDPSLCGAAGCEPAESK